MGNYTYTKLGRQYFAEKPRRYILSIPVLIGILGDEREALQEAMSFETAQRIKFVRKYGGWYDAKKVSHAVRVILEKGVEGGDANKLKDLVLKQMATDRGKDEAWLEKVKRGEEIMVVYEESDVRAIYDPTREWEYSMEKIMGIDEPMVTTQAVLNRPLNGFKVPCAHIEDVMQEAFENDAVNCVIRQICAKYCFERAEVEAEFDDIAQTIAPERAKGITAI